MLLAVNTVKRMQPGAQKDHISAALDLYRLEVGSYPSTQQGLMALVKKPAGVSGWKGPYMKNPETFRITARRFQYEFPTFREGAGEYLLVEKR